MAKRFISWLLAASVCLGICGCSADQTPTGSPQESFPVDWQFTARDRKSTPFEKIVFAGDCLGEWTDTLVQTIAECQLQMPQAAMTQPEVDTIAQAQPDLVILGDGVQALLNGTSPEQWGENLRGRVKEIRGAVAEDTVLMLTGLPYLPQADAYLLARYNATIRAVAMGENLLYADLCAAQSARIWTVSDDGVTPNTMGKILLQGEVLQVLLKNCSCLAVNTHKPLSYGIAQVPCPREEILTQLRTADADGVLSALESGDTGVDTSLFETLTQLQRETVCATIAQTDRSGWTDYRVADAMVNGAVMTYLAEQNPVSQLKKQPVTYISVGDSISVGSGSITPKTDGWVPTLTTMLTQLQGKRLYNVNLAISGTRMSTTHNSGQYEAAKDTVEEFVVSKKPDFLTIGYGINDQNQGTSLETFLKDYRQYLQTVTTKCPDTVVAVIGICWEGRDPAGDPLVRQWNRELRKLTEEFDGVIYCEVYPDMYGSEWLLADGLHPNNAGHICMANAVFRSLCRYLDFAATQNP